MNKTSIRAYTKIGQVIQSMRSEYIFCCSGRISTGVASPNSSERQKIQTTILSIFFSYASYLPGLCSGKDLRYISIVLHVSLFIDHYESSASMLTFAMQARLYLKLSDREWQSHCTGSCPDCIILAITFLSFSFNLTAGTHFFLLH